MFYEGVSAVVVAQSDDAHERIQETLTLLRDQPAGGEPGPAAAAAEPPKKGSYVEVYTLNVGDGAAQMQQVVQMVIRMVDPESWSQPEHAIMTVGKTLVVKHEQATQERVWRLLDEVFHLRGSAGCGAGVGAGGVGGFMGGGQVTTTGPERPAREGGPASARDGGGFF